MPVALITSVNGDGPGRRSRAGEENTPILGGSAEIEESALPRFDRDANALTDG
jgi:hypothetical protein